MIPKINQYILEINRNKLHYLFKKGGNTLEQKITKYLKTELCWKCTIYLAKQNLVQKFGEKYSKSEQISH